VTDRDPGFLASFMDDYFAECDEHLAAIRPLVLVLEASAGSQVAPGVIEELFRSFHSIKGISGMVDLREAETLAHHMESYLRALRERDAQVTEAGVDALIAGVDALERTIAARREGQPAAPIDRTVEQLTSVLPARHAQVSTGSSVAAPEGAGAASLRATFTPSAELLARGVNVDSVRARLRAVATIVDAAPKVTPHGIAFEFLLDGQVDEDTRDEWRGDGVIVEDVHAPAAAGPERVPEEATPRPVQPSHVVRVDLTRLDELMWMIGDLVITRARLEAALARVERHVPAVEWRAVQENSQTIERQLRDLREGVMRVRLVPVGEIFRRMPFVVRDLARETDTTVQLELRGQETEIDKFLIERMLDPVLHLVRNAVSHGFETSAERVAAGKAAHGTLTLAAAGVGETVVLEIADDGRGIDAVAVAARARSLGYTVPDGPLDAGTLLDLICAPGFSTREESDRASGRGVGMAVVKRTVEELNGTLSLQSTFGEGTRFIIELPLTLAIADALLATVGDRTFAVPQSSVREVIEVDPASIRQAENNELAPLRGGVLPIRRLSRIFGLAERPRRALHVFVIGSGADAVGIAVDRIVGQREIVVRSMADRLIKVPGIVGATDLGDGRAVLILDLAAIARRARTDGNGTLERAAGRRMESR
jgi:two-component system chemotaxis sensor kinase CheA